MNWLEKCSRRRFVLTGLGGLIAGWWESLQRQYPGLKPETAAAHMKSLPGEEK